MNEIRIDDYLDYMTELEQEIQDWEIENYKPEIRSPKQDKEYYKQLFERNKLTGRDDPF